MKKYYFIYYRCTKSDGSVIHAQALEKIHPLKFQIDCNEKYPHEDILVCSWQEITEVEYKKFNGHIG